MAEAKQGLSYAAAGVDIDAGNALVERIKPAARSTNRAGVIAGLGGFGGLFDLKAAGFNDPILVAATDGVGTKLRIAIDTGKVDTIGIDLVAMCVNDLVCQGAEPLFFLDYFATGSLDVDQGARIIEGIAEGCKKVGCALIGGETAEMPGMYEKGDFDLAGFSVGALERGQGLPKDVSEGDVLFGLRSNGIHSNGYSLARKIVEYSGFSWISSCPFSAGTLGEAFITPTRLYVRPCLAALKTNAVRAFAHITGGGLHENILRVLQEGQGVEIDLNSWESPAIFRWLAEKGSITEREMLKTFNCGIGMVIVAASNNKENVRQALFAAGEDVIEMGYVTGSDGVRYLGKHL